MLNNTFFVTLASSRTPTSPSLPFLVSQGKVGKDSKDQVRNGKDRSKSSKDRPELLNNTFFVTLASLRAPTSPSLPFLSHKEKLAKIAKIRSEMAKTDQKAAKTGQNR